VTLFILDPNLTPHSGHHLDWDLMIAKVARERGEKVVIFAHQSCEATPPQGVEIIPWFRHTCYDIRSRRPYTGKFDDFRYFNDVIADDLLKLSHERFTALDCVFVPTLTELHLLGYVSWIKTFDKARAPLFVVHLMFPSGLAVSRHAPTTVVDPQQAAFYGLAFQRAAEPGADIHFFGGGRQIAREFAELSGLPIEAHGVPFCLAKEEGARPERPTVLLYAGDAKDNKGFHLVPEVAARLARAYPGWDFLIHANDSTAWGDLRAAFDALQEIAAQTPNIRFMKGRLSREDYDDVMRQADCMVSTYDPVQYARKSSGVLWESISLGLPVLAPADCWIANEAEEWGAGFMTYSPHTAEAICERFAEFAAQFDTLRETSREAAKLYQEFNGPNALFNQFGHLWAARLAAAKLAGQPTLRKLAIEVQEGAGLSWSETLDDAPVRWTEREFEISFDWKFYAPWTLTIGAPRFIGEAQIIEASATTAEGEALAVVSDVRNGFGSIAVSGPGGEGDGRRVVRIKLPWTYRPEGESRDLGILVRDLSVGPAEGVASPLSAGHSPVRILSPVVWQKAGFSFKFTAPVSGAVALDPAEDAEIQLILETPAPPPFVHAIRLYVNGVELAPNWVWQAEGRWRLQATASRGVIAVNGFDTQWHLLIDPSLGQEVSVDAVISDMSFRQESRRSGALVARIVTDAPSKTDAGAVVDADSAAKAIADVKPAPMAPTRRKQLLIDGFGLSGVRVDEFLPERNGYRHLDLSIFDLSTGEDEWSHIKFKLCHFNGTTYLEFRNAPDWPKVFRIWPSTDEDAFGPVLRWPDPTSGALPSFVDPSDRRALSAILSCLDEVVRFSLAEAECSRDQIARWIDDADELAQVACSAPLSATLGGDPVRSTKPN